MNITTENRISDIAEAVSRDFHADRRQQNADNWVNTLPLSGTG